jgi:predicted RNase H-related nuclease YkuK (DUF458 family)
MRRRLDLNEVKDYIENSSESTRIYIGADSERHRRGGVWFADYATVVVIHIDGNRGAKVFGEITTERDYDQSKDKPRMRLMNEVMKAAELYLELAECIGNRECEVHIDINPDHKHGSSCVISEAVGYIRGMTGVTPRVKPEAWAASIAADKFPELAAN